MQDARRRRCEIVAENKPIMELYASAQDRPALFTDVKAIKGGMGRATQVDVVNMDTLDAAHIYHCPLVLNFASSRHLGGGYLHGASAQEEQICYRSTLPNSLKYLKYPWSKRSQLVYSPRVVVFRQSEANNFKRVQQEDIAVISAAALFHPAVYERDGKQFFTRVQDAAYMQHQMRTILRIAATFGHTRLVLGAWGCGAFGGPAYHTALLWKNMLADPEFAGVFERVVMAVFGRDGNFETFVSVFA